MLYPQNDDRIVTMDHVTSLHPKYINDFGQLLGDELVLGLRRRSTLGKRSIVMRVSVCLSARISLEHRVKTSPIL